VERKRKNMMVSESASLVWGMPQLSEPTTQKLPLPKQNWN